MDPPNQHFLARPRAYVILLSVRPSVRLSVRLTIDSGRKTYSIDLKFSTNVYHVNLLDEFEDGKDRSNRKKVMAMATTTGFLCSGGLGMKIELYPIALKFGTHV